MKITPLWKAVAEEGARAVKVNEDLFEVGSAQYEEKKHWFIKGGYTIVEGRTDYKVLQCGKLEKDLIAKVGDYKLEGVEDAEEVVTVVFFHKQSLEMAGKEVQRKHIGNFSDACMQSFSQKHNIDALNLDDFATVVIDWEKRNIQIRPI